MDVPLSGVEAQSAKYRDSLPPSLAVRPLAASPQLRKTLITIHQRDEQTIDTISKDMVREAGFSVDATENARATIASFQEFIAQNHDEIAALQILYNRPYGQQRLTFQQNTTGGHACAAPPSSLNRVSRAGRRGVQVPHTNRFSPLSNLGKGPGVRIFRTLQ